MGTENLIFTVSAEDRPGVVKSLSDVLLECEGNWLESELSRLCGRFTGIAHVQIAASHKTTFLLKMQELTTQGVTVIVHPQINDAKHYDTAVDIHVEANDRPGILDEIVSALAVDHINVEQLATECESASMAGYNLFKANLTVGLPDNISEEQLENILENVSDDLIVSTVAN